jgi:hypothetical protein
VGISAISSSQGTATEQLSMSEALGIGILLFKVKDVN